jgi:hypothetical protein
MPAPRTMVLLGLVLFPVALLLLLVLPFMDKERSHEVDW